MGTGDNDNDADEGKIKSRKFGEEIWIRSCGTRDRGTMEKKGARKEDLCGDGHAGGIECGGVSCGVIQEWRIVNLQRRGRVRHVRKRVKHERNDRSIEIVGFLILEAWQAEKAETCFCMVRCAMAFFFNCGGEMLACLLASTAKQNLAPWSWKLGGRLRARGLSIHLDMICIGWERRYVQMCNMRGNVKVFPNYLWPILTSGENLHRTNETKNPQPTHARPEFNCLPETSLSRTT